MPENSQMDTKEQIQHNGTKTNNKKGGTQSNNRKGGTQIVHMEASQITNSIKLGNLNAFEQICVLISFICIALFDVIIGITGTVIGTLSIRRTWRVDFLLLFGLANIVIGLTILIVSVALFFVVAVRILQGRVEGNNQISQSQSANN